MVTQRDSSIHTGPIDLSRFRRELDLGGDPLYDLVPREVEENLVFREKIINWGSADLENARLLWTMCKRSLLFYVSAFVWTYDSREIAAYPCLPFIPYPYQEECFAALSHAIGRHDALIDKSRGMGASWMGITVIEWRWHFYDRLSFLLVSRKEELVDKSGDPKALFWKIDFIHENLPGWLMPSIDRKNLHLFSYDTGSTVDGEATTGDVARGDYRTAIFLDEFAAVRPISDGYRALNSTQGATRCRIFNSTTQGAGNAYYDQKKKGTPRISLHWPLHPVYSKGLTIRADGKPTSPWYEAECIRAAHPSLIAQELDMDDEAADDSFFETSLLNKCMRHTGDPYIEGELLFDADTLEPQEFVERPGGRLKLWVNLTGDLGPPPGDYVLGSDISAGTGSSNSATTGGDKKTGEKVAEFVDNQISPEAFADFNVALARWFKPANARTSGLDWVDAVELDNRDTPEEGAFVIWENNGPAGKIFSRRLIDSGYRHFYSKQKEDTISKKGTDAPGWVTTRTTKAILLGEYRIALRDDLFLNRSVRALNECRMYVYGPGGDILHTKSRFTGLDPSGSGDSHGDIVIADALTWQGMKWNAREEVAPEPEILWGSYLWRQERRKSAEAAEDVYGERATDDAWLEELVC